MFHIGPAPVTAAVVVTWAIMAVLAVGSALLTRRLSLDPSRIQAVCELIVDTVDSQIRDTMQLEPGPLPGVHRHAVRLHLRRQLVLAVCPAFTPPTAHLETDAALWRSCSCSAPSSGSASAPAACAATSRPSPRRASSWCRSTSSRAVTRTFSLFVRLFGNVMSGVFVIGIVLSLAGLLVPIPLMALDLLIGAVQAYIFAILAMVFISSAIPTAMPQAQPRKRMAP